MMRPRSRRRVTTSLILIVSAIAACGRQAPPPATTSSSTSEPTAAETAALAALPIHVERNLDSNLYLVGLAIALKPGGSSWEISLSSKVLRPQTTRAPVWVHAYPPDSSDYLVLDPGRSSQSQSGHVVNDGFVLAKPGAFNLYAGVTRSDGTLGLAVPLGWIAVGDPASPELRGALKILAAKGAAARAALMLEQALRDHPGVSFPEEQRVAIESEGGRFGALLPYYQRRITEGWRPARIDDWLALTATIQAAGWADESSALDAMLRDVPPQSRAAAAMAEAARRRARGQDSGQSAAVPYQLQFTSPAASAAVGHRLLGLDVVPVERTRGYRIYLFMQGDRDMTDDGQFWLHAYPEKSTSYDEAAPVPVPHPAALKAGHSTWRVFALSRPGAYNVYIGSMRPDGSLGPAESLGWVAVGQPNSPAFVEAVRAIAATDAPTRALDIATGMLREYPQNAGLKRLAAELTAVRAGQPPSQD